MQQQIYELEDLKERQLQQRRDKLIRKKVKNAETKLIDGYSESIKNVKFEGVEDITGEVQEPDTVTQQLQNAGQTITEYLQSSI